MRPGGLKSNTDIRKVCQVGDGLPGTRCTQAAHGWNWNLRLSLPDIVSYVSSAGLSVMSRTSYESRSTSQRAGIMEDLNLSQCRTHDMIQKW